MPDFTDPSSLGDIAPGATFGDSTTSTTAQGPYTSPAPMIPVDVPPPDVYAQSVYRFPISQIQPQNTFLSSAVESISKATPQIVGAGMATIAAVGTLGALGVLGAGGAAAGVGTSSAAAGTSAVSTSTAVATTAGFTEVAGSAGSILGTIGTVASVAGTAIGVAQKVGLFGSPNKTPQPVPPPPLDDSSRRTGVLPSYGNLPRKLAPVLAPSAKRGINSTTLGVVILAGAAVLFLLKG